MTTLNKTRRVRGLVEIFNSATDDVPEWTIIMQYV